MGILGASNAMIFVFDRDRGFDRKFNDRMTAFRAKELRAYAKNEKNEKTTAARSVLNAKAGGGGRIEKGNGMYYEEDTRCCVYIGIKYVMRVRIDADADSDEEFAVIRDLKHWLKGITFDCAHFLYIYHQKTLVVMKRVQAAAQCPFQMRIYTGNKLRFQ